MFIPYLTDYGWFGFETFQDWLSWSKEIIAAYEASDFDTVNRLRALNPGVCFLYELVGFNRDHFLIFKTHPFFALLFFLALAAMSGYDHVL